MGALKFSKKRVRGLNAEAWGRLASVFNEERGFQAHEIANYAGSNRRLARAIMFALAADGLADLWLLVFHICNGDTFVEERPLAEGFPILPWECPSCGEEVETGSELRYDMLCVTRGAIEISR